MSRRSRRALVQELYTPADADEITYDEGYDIDGGMEWLYYLSNQQVWDACATIYGDYQSLNKALIAGGTTVVGWVAAGVALAAASIATVLVGCLVSGKGFEIKFTWNPKWYNHFNGFSLSRGWK